MLFFILKIELGPTSVRACVRVRPSCEEQLISNLTIKASRTLARSYSGEFDKAD